MENHYQMIAKMRNEHLDLQAALAKIEAFTSKNIPAENISLNKTIGLMHTFFAAKLFDRKKEKKRSQVLEEHKELLRAIDVVKNHLQLIEKLRSGTPQQQKFASSALNTVERFNGLIECSEKTSESLSSRIHVFLQEYSGQLLPKHLMKIPLPKVVILSSDAAPSTYKVDHVSLKMVSWTQRPIPFLSRQGVEHFNMKTISLLEKQGFRPEDARIAVQKGEVTCVKDEDPSTCTAHCYIENFVIQIKFLKDVSKDTYTCIIGTPSINLICSHTDDPVPHA